MLPTVPLCSLTQTNMDSIKKVIAYSWRDEAKHYLADPIEDHIFTDLIKAKIYVWCLEGYAGKPMNALRDFLYSQSPFDLASDEDNVYRDLVDKLIKQ